MILHFAEHLNKDICRSIEEVNVNSRKGDNCGGRESVECLKFYIKLVLKLTVIVPPLISPFQCHFVVVESARVWVELENVRPRPRDGLSELEN